MDLSPLMQNLGAAGWAVVLVVLRFIYRELSNIRDAMVTKDGLTIAMQKMKDELEEHVEGRFQSKEHAAEFANGHSRALSNLRREFIDRARDTGGY